MSDFAVVGDVSLKLLQGNLKEISKNIKDSVGNIKIPIQVSLKIDPSEVKKLQDQLKTISLNVNLKGNGGSLRDITSQVNDLKRSIQQVNNTTVKPKRASRSQVQASPQAVSRVKDIKAEEDAIVSFGKASGLALKRFLAFSIAAGPIYAVGAAIRSGLKDAIEFDRELVRVSQVTGVAVKDLGFLTEEISRLSKTFGVSSSNLIKVAVTLAQAGLTAKDTKVALEALAKTEISATFGDITKTTEASIAIMQQFKVQAKDLENVLSRVNAVSAAFAVESEDIAVAVRRAGGSFAAAGGTIDEFNALFTSVRQTTRESAESIATGLRTIFTRIQRGDTIEFLERLGIQLRDVKGQFIGPYESIRRLSTALKDLPTTDPRFAQIVEELGGFRQVSKVIPLIQQFGISQRALNVALTGGNSLSKDAEVAQQALSIQIKKVKEEFLELGRTIVNSTGFKIMIDFALTLASALTKLTNALVPLLPALTLLGGIKLARAGLGAIPDFKQVFGTKRNAGGIIPGSGNTDTVPAMLTPGEFVIRKEAVSKIGITTLKKLNQAQGFNKGGYVGYASGGLVANIPVENANKKQLEAVKEVVKQMKDLGINVEKINVASIKFVDNLEYKGKKADGLAYSNRNIGIDTKLGGNRLKQVLLHEFGHQIERDSDGKLSSTKPNTIENSLTKSKKSQLLEDVKNTGVASAFPSMQGRTISKDVKSEYNKQLLKNQEIFADMFGNAVTTGNLDEVKESLLSRGLIEPDKPIENKTPKEIYSTLTKEKQLLKQDQDRLKEKEELIKDKYKQLQEEKRVLKETEKELRNVNRQRKTPSGLKNNVNLIAQQGLVQRDIEKRQKVVSNIESGINRTTDNVDIDRDVIVDRSQEISRLRNKFKYSQEVAGPKKPNGRERLDESIRRKGGFPIDFREKLDRKYPPRQPKIPTGGPPNDPPRPPRRPLQSNPFDSFGNLPGSELPAQPEKSNLKGLLGLGAIAFLPALTEQLNKLSGSSNEVSQTFAKLATSLSGAAAQFAVLKTVTSNITANKLEASITPLTKQKEFLTASRKTLTDRISSIQGTQNPNQFGKTEEDRITQIKKTLPNLINSNSLVPDGKTKQQISDLNAELNNLFNAKANFQEFEGFREKAIRQQVELASGTKKQIVEIDKEIIAKEKAAKVTGRLTNYVLGLAVAAQAVGQFISDLANKASLEGKTQTNIPLLGNVGTVNAARAGGFLSGAATGAQSLGTLGFLVSGGNPLVAGAAAAVGGIGGGIYGGVTGGKDAERNITIFNLNKSVDDLNNTLNLVNSNRINKDSGNVLLRTQFGGLGKELDKNFGKEEFSSVFNTVKGQAPSLDAFLTKLAESSTTLEDFKKKNKDLIDLYLKLTNLPLAQFDESMKGIIVSMRRNKELQADAIKIQTETNRRLLVLTSFLGAINEGTLSLTKFNNKLDFILSSGSGEAVPINNNIDELLNAVKKGQIRDLTDFNQISRNATAGFPEVGTDSIIAANAISKIPGILNSIQIQGNRLDEDELGTKVREIVGATVQGNDPSSVLIRDAVINAIRTEASKRTKDEGGFLQAFRTNPEKVIQEVITASGLDRSIDRIGEAANAVAKNIKEEAEILSKLVQSERKILELREREISIQQVKFDAFEADNTRVPLKNRLNVANRDVENLLGFNRDIPLGINEIGPRLAEIQKALVQNRDNMFANRGNLQAQQAGMGIESQLLREQNILITAVNKLAQSNDRLTLVNNEIARQRKDRTTKEDFLAGFVFGDPATKREIAQDIGFTAKARQEGIDAIPENQRQRVLRLAKAFGDTPAPFFGNKVDALGKTVPITGNEFITNLLKGSKEGGIIPGVTIPGVGENEAKNELKKQINIQLEANQNLIKIQENTQKLAEQAAAQQKIEQVQKNAVAKAAQENRIQDVGRLQGQLGLTRTRKQAIEAAGAQDVTGARENFATFKKLETLASEITNINVQAARLDKVDKEQFFGVNSKFATPEELKEQRKILDTSLDTGRKLGIPEDKLSEFSRSRNPLGNLSNFMRTELVKGKEKQAQDLNKSLPQGFNRGLDNKQRQVLERSLQGADGQNLQQLREREKALEEQLNQQIKAINNFKDASGQLSASMDNFPREVIMQGNHVIDLRITGAQALAQFEPLIKKLLNNSITEAIANLNIKLGTDQV